MVVIRPNQLRHHVIIQPLHLFAVGNIDAFCSFHGNRFQFLCAHHRACPCAAAVVAAVEHTGERHEVFTRLTNRRHAGFRRGHPANFFRGRTGAFSPQEIGFFESDLVVFNIQPDGGCRLAFNNDGVITCEFHLRREKAAHMCIDNQIAFCECGERRDINARATGSAGSSKRSRRKN